MKATRTVALLLAFGSGVIAMYFGDRAKGRRRRIGIRDELQHTLLNTGKFLTAAKSDFEHRAAGLSSLLRHSLHKPIGNDDPIVLARIRSKLGRLVRHPHAIEVVVSNGHATLRGPVLVYERNRLLRRISKLRGVRHIESHLVPYRHGVIPRKFDRFELLQTNWSPAARLLVLGAGTCFFILGILGLRRRPAFSALLAFISAGFVARALSNIEAGRLFGISGDTNAVTVHKTINISAPIFRVYRFMTDLANFSHFMTDVVEVKATGNNRFHWVVRGLAGFPVSWNAVISRHIPNEVLAWRSEPGALVKHTGHIRFSANKDGSTQINVVLSYCPPGGAMGHALAKLFGDDPKAKMNEDLMRLKTLIESGPSNRQRSHGVVMH